MSERPNWFKSERKRSHEAPVICQNSEIDWDKINEKLKICPKKAKEHHRQDNEKKQIQLVSFFKIKDADNSHESREKKDNAPKSTLSISQEEVFGTPKGIEDSPIKSIKTDFGRLNRIELPSSGLALANRQKSSFKQRNQQRYYWLEDVRDALGRTTDDPCYDCSTLYIPKDAWDQFSPFERRFWEIKSEYADTVMFFKKGKFFELYENDADLGNKHFNLKVTERVNMRMAGVPECSFEYWAMRFLELGFKVAKVMQTESTIKKAMREREEASSLGIFSRKRTEEKIVNRELDCILTPGTLCDPALINSDESSYCVSIIEVLNDHSNSSSFAMCILEASISEFSLIYIENDIDYVKLLTVLAQIRPKEIVLRKESFPRKALVAVKSVSEDAIIIQRNQNEDLARPENVISELKSRGYLSDIPETLQNASDAEICAFGVLLDYLEYLKIAENIIPNGEYKFYELGSRAKTMFLDAKSILNLEIFKNSDNEETGTLNKTLNKCITAFGKRLFCRILSQPLVNPGDIEARLDAGDEIYDNVDLYKTVEACLSKIPDLERLAARTYSGKVSLPMFITLIDGIQHAVKSLSKFSLSVRSSLLVDHFSVFSPEAGIEEKILRFRSCFDEGKALEEEIVEFKPGSYEELDAANKAIQKLENELESYRIAQSRRLGCPIKYRSIGKEWFQMEIPKHIKAPIGWQIKSDSASVSRYWDSKVESLNLAYKEAMEVREDALTNAEQNLYAMFSEYSKCWNLVIKKLANIDVLVCLAKIRMGIPDPKCRPVVHESPLTYISLEDARGPAEAQRSYVLNDVSMGGNNPNFTLLTGPNMGGKSTLLRMVCNISIMAQIGCYVPATSCSLTPFDKIFTRIGASDDIIAGKSTFMVELSETSNILNNATNRSLVILDEFGRGTSTFDGCSIAFATLYDLLVRKDCIGLFSTHYHLIADSYKDAPFLSLKYMDYLVESDNNIMFLYKLRSGICPKSYGMNAASMAGIPDSVVNSASQISSRLEEIAKEKLKARKSTSSNLLCTLSSLKSVLFSDSSTMLSLSEEFRRLVKTCTLYRALSKSR